MNRRQLFQLTPLILAIACIKSPTAEEECPWAAERGIRGPGVVPCWIAGTQDRVHEFKLANGLTATCKGDVYVNCSGVTSKGAPVKFKCDGHGCEFIATWAW